MNQTQCIDKLLSLQKISGDCGLKEAEDKLVTLNEVLKYLYKRVGVYETYEYYRMKNRLESIHAANKIARNTYDMLRWITAKETCYTPTYAFKLSFSRNKGLRVQTGRNEITLDGVVWSVLANLHLFKIMDFKRVTLCTTCGTYYAYKHKRVLSYSGVCKYCESES